MEGIQLTDLGIVCALGAGKEEVLRNAYLADAPGFKRSKAFIPERDVWVGEVVLLFLL